jgi:glycosyltransferase involved in cell wall biosynthesis
MKERRILVWYWSATGGGGSRFAVNLSRRLAKRCGPGAVRLSLHAEDPLVAEARSEPDFETLAAPVATNRRHPLRTLLKLSESARVLAEHVRDCDAVIVPMNFANAAPLAGALRQPLAYFAHDPEPHPGDHATIAQRATQALLLSKASRVVALSHYAANELKRLGVAEQKLATVPLSAVFEPRARAPRDAGPIQLLLAGRMMAYKGLDLLAEALPALAGRDDWRLTIAGEGPALDRAMLERLTHPSVEIAPAWLSDAALDAKIAACDILLAPYRSATQSGVAAQALAHGRPAIVTPVGALPEQIGQGAAGWCAQAANGAAFGEALVQALKDDKAWDAKSKGAFEMAWHAWDADHWAWLDTM